MGEPSRKSAGPRMLGKLLHEGSIGLRSDADLVQMAATRDKETAEAAFATLIERHGPMVQGVCRRILGDEHAAEDAFQAVFLVLARKVPDIRVDDSLGRWLYGVSKKVARRARGLAARSIPAPVASSRVPDEPPSVAVREEIRRIVDREVALLPRKYRQAAALCHLDGLSHEQAAEALGVPVGTVRSRLSRARDILRPRLIRRGLAPAAVAAWMGSPTASAIVPRSLAESTLALVGPATVAIPPAILALVEIAPRTLALKKLAILVALAAAGGLSVGFLALSGGQGPSNEPPTPQAPAAEAKKAEGPSLADEVRRIIHDYDAATERWQEERRNLSKGDIEQRERQGVGSPKLANYAHRVVDLIAANPEDPSGRDGLLWVINFLDRVPIGDYGQAYSRAAYLLVEHYADDPDVARSGFKMDNHPTRSRDAFLEGIYVVAENRETRGLIRLALARYLWKKAAFAEGSRNLSRPRPTMILRNTEQGVIRDVVVPRSIEERGYDEHTRTLDAPFLRAESERLCEEVIAQYADISYVAWRRRELELRLRRKPSPADDVLDKKQREDAERRLAIPSPNITLGQMAAELLDEIRNLGVGKPAPDIEGTDIDGKPIKLSDYRGRVVAVCFWGAPGPLEFLNLSRLAETMKGRPFIVLSVLYSDFVEKAKRAVQERPMPWPNIWSGGERIGERYHLAQNPFHRLFIIDENGVLRSRSDAMTDANVKLVESLVAEAEAKAKGRSPGPDR